VTELATKIAEIDHKHETRISQVKEKFGGLRFYINHGTNEIFDLIHEYENKSYTVCEVCGKAGKCRNDIGWIRTLCEEHYNEIKQAP